MASLEDEVAELFDADGETPKKYVGVRLGGKMLERLEQSWKKKYPGLRYQPSAALEYFLARGIVCYEINRKGPKHD
jgi:hypothetical protein